MYIWGFYSLTYFRKLPAFLNCDHASALRCCWWRPCVFRPSHCLVRWCVWSNIVTTISRERLEQFWYHSQGIFTSPIDGMIRFWRSSEFRVTAGLCVWRRQSHLLVLECELEGMLMSAFMETSCVTLFNWWFDVNVLSVNWNCLLVGVSVTFLYCLHLLLWFSFFST